MHKCAEYLRKHGLHRTGLFRVAGHELTMNLVRVRIQPPPNASKEQMRAMVNCIMIGEEVTPCSFVYVHQKWFLWHS
jgi:hypothetical protein